MGLEPVITIDGGEERNPINCSINEGEYMSLYKRGEER